LSDPEPQFQGHSIV